MRGKLETRENSQPCFVHVKLSNTNTLLSTYILHRLLALYLTLERASAQQRIRT